jgi:coenzyme F420-dependent glucose-6-phosphate dehydrogenase
MQGFVFHASHEQFRPSQLLHLAVLAEKNGFDGIHSSDHFYPWSVRQGQSGFTFSWIGAAMQATTIPFSMICTPGQRYHPAIAAQAIATICEMFPGRYTVELGSGEALNEKITGDEWPDKAERNERLKECAMIIRKLLQGEEVTFEGYVKVKDAKLYTLPEQKPLLYCAAITEETAGWAGHWADGLVTVSGALDDLKSKMRAFRENAGKSKPVSVKYSFSYHTDREVAIDGAYDQWRTNVLAPEKLADFAKPEQFDRAAEKITREDMARLVPIHTRIEEVLEAAGNIMRNGANSVVLHNVNRHQELFIQHFGKWKNVQKNGLS